MPLRQRSYSSLEVQAARGKSANLEATVKRYCGTGLWPLSTISIHTLCHSPAAHSPLMPADLSMRVLPVVQAPLVVVSEPREKGESHAALVAPSRALPPTQLQQHTYMWMATT